MFRTVYDVMTWTMTKTRTKTMTKTKIRTNNLSLGLDSNSSLKELDAVDLHLVSIKINKLKPFS